MLTMKKTDSFNTGDLVAVFGGEIGKEGKHADSVSICKVLVCGENDLIVEDSSGKSYSRPNHHTVSKAICQKLFMNADILSSSATKDPEIGDLVVSYFRESFKEEPAEQTTGILYKTTYKLGRPHKSTLICGTEMKEVYHASLIVLQSNKKE